MKAKNLISINELSLQDINKLFRLTDDIKSKGGKFNKVLQGKSLGLLFQKPSNRTRVSFAVGMTQLGGHSVYLGPDEIQLGKRETVKDVAKVLSGYLDGIVARTYSHDDVMELAKHSDIPVINGLSDLLHPCQALSDLYTIREKMPNLKKVKLAYIGDGNNVLNSLLTIGAKTGLNITAATPKGYGPNRKILIMALKNAKASGSQVKILNDPVQAIKDADFVYTDVWVSMGREAEKKKRLKAFKSFQINLELLKKGKKNCLVMHCLPAHRQQEITSQVMDSKNSIVFEQAENRLHVQKSILITLLK